MKSVILIILVCFTSVFCADLFIEQFMAYTPYAQKFNWLLQDISNEVQHPTREPTIMQNVNKLPLFQAYPELEQHISYIPLGSLPTPVRKCFKLSKYTNRTIYVKRDDQTGAHQDTAILFGGNKVRKLEFLLADALAHDKKAVMTFGCAGSNHVTATATYARMLGLDCICMLMPQPRSPVVQRNLLLMKQAQAAIHYGQTTQLRSLAALYTSLRYHQLHGVYPYIIPTGGSCARGVLGYVNAVYELKEQIDQNNIPEPDVIYVPIGSGGTITGLLLGIKAAGLKARVVGIAVEPEPYDGFLQQTVQQLFYQTNELLCALSKRFERFELKQTDYSLLLNYTGSAYGLITKEAQEAMHIGKGYAHITLDPTYSSKAFAGMLDQLRNHTADEVILFWHTFDARDFQLFQMQIDWRQLPMAVQHYFTDLSSGRSGEKPLINKTVKFSI